MHSVQLSRAPRAAKLAGTVQRAFAAVLGVVQRSIRRHALVEAGERVLVAVSGGPDSVGLLAILDQLQHRLGIELVAAHVNHRLRGTDSDADEACAAEAAARLQVRFVRIGLSRALSRGGNLEARAREQRYAALQELAGKHCCQKIATGHTQDDQAETVLLRLIRGAGPVGLAGIQPRRGDGVIRPLIDCPRAEIERVVRLTGLRYRLDRSNEDPRFQRTHVRNRVLPLLAELNPRIRRACANVATLARAEREIAARWADEQVAAIAPQGKVNAAALTAVPPALRGHVVRRWLMRGGVPLRQLAVRHVNAVVRLGVGRRASGAVTLPGGLQVWRRAGELGLGALLAGESYPPQVLSPRHPVTLPGGWRLVAWRLQCGGGRLRLPDDLWSAVCDAQEIAAPLTVRAAMRGERMRPLGLGGSRKLSDIFTDHKVPADERWVYPVVASGAEIIWIPGVVRSDAFQVSEKTRSGFWLRAERARRRL